MDASGAAALLLCIHHPHPIFPVLSLQVLRDTGRLLGAFFLGSIGTTVGTLVALKLLPLSTWLGEHGWKMASALMSRHIGGAASGNPPQPKDHTPAESLSVSQCLHCFVHHGTKY